MEQEVNLKHHHVSHHKLLKILHKCTVTCQKMTTMLTYKPDIALRVNQIRLLQDCADFCDTTENYLARKSYFTKALVNQCAYICETCGSECLKFGDSESQRCARICLDCAEECKEFVLH